MPHNGSREVAGAGLSEAKEDPAHLRLAFSGASLPLVAPAPATRPSVKLGAALDRLRRGVEQVRTGWYSLA